MIRCFKREGVQQAVMAGKVHKTVMHTPLALLPPLARLADHPVLVSPPPPRQPRRHVLLGVIDEFAADGICV